MGAQTDVNFAEEYEEDLGLIFEEAIKAELRRRNSSKLSRRDMIDLVVKVNPLNDKVKCLVRASECSGKKAG